METKKQLKEQIKDLTEVRDRYRRGFYLSLDEYRNIKKENNELEYKLRLLEKEIEIKHLDLSSLEKTNKELRENLDIVELEKEISRKAVEKRDKKIKSIEEENDNLKKELSKSKDTINNYIDVLTNAICKIVKLTNELEKVSKKPKKED